MALSRGGICVFGPLVLFMFMTTWSVDGQTCGGATKCDLRLRAMTLTPPEPSIAAGSAVDIDFSATLENDDNTDDIVAVTGANLNYDCTMRYASTNIGTGGFPVPDNLATPAKKFSTHCGLGSDPQLKAGLFANSQFTLTGTCNINLPNANCEEAKFLCLDCTTPGTASFMDKNPNKNNRKCIRIDDKLTCNIDLELKAKDINNLCATTFKSDVDTTVTIPKLTVENKNTKKNKLNNIKEDKTGNSNFKFDIYFTDKAAPAFTGANKIQTVAGVDSWNDKLDAEKDVDHSFTKIDLKLSDASCPTVTHACMHVSKGTTTGYNEKTGTPALDDNNWQCCAITKSCKLDPRANAVAINPAATFKADTAVNTVLDVTLENLGPGPIIAATAGAKENFKFQQFFAAGDYCANKALAIHPAAKCDSTITGASANSKSAGLIVGAGNTKVFKIDCSMTLTTVVCKSMTNLCVDFKSGTDATYNEGTTNEANNCKCITLVTKACQPNVKADTLSESGGPVEVKDYVTPNQPTMTLSFRIENTESVASSIPASLPAATDNFDAKCWMANAAKAKIGTPSEVQATVTANKDAGLAGGNAKITLTMTAQFGTMPVADCPNVDRICCRVYAPGAPPNYVETDTTDNTACTTAAITKNCKPVFTGDMDNPGLKTISINEDQAIGTANDFFTLPGTDPTDKPSAAETLTYTEVIGDGSDYFGITSGNKVYLKKALDYENGAIPKTFTITYKVEDQDGASSTGQLKIDVIDINEKPTIAQAFAPDPTTITSKGVVGTTGGPLIYGVPEDYSGSIYKFTFTDPDAADTAAISTYNTPKITFPTTPGITNPFTIVKNGANEGILSINPGVIDKEGISQYKVEIVACDNGPPAPLGAKICSDPIEITLNVINIDEPPKWDASTIKPVTIKEDVTAVNTNLITVKATDVDTTDLLFKMQCTPATDIFDYTPNTKTGKSMTITQKANPGFNHEGTSTYTCYIWVMDGHNVAVMDKVTITIEDVPEDPVMNLPASGKIPIPEMHCYGCHLYDYQCTDQDAGQKTSSTFLVYDTPFDRQAKSKFQLDVLDRLLLNFDNNILRTKLDKYLVKFTCCDDTSPKPRCIYKNITLEVEQSNQAPWLNPNTTGITLYENQATGVNIPLDLTKKFHDPEGRNPTCTIRASRYSTFFTTSGNNLRLANALNYDTYNPPHHFYITITCSDGGGITRTDAPNVPSLRTEMLVEVNVLGIDDHTPAFAPVNYVTTLYEDAVSTQSVVRVTASDADLGVHGQMIYQLDPTDPNKVLANSLFAIVRITNNEAEIRCRGGLNAEKYSSVIFKVNAVSPGPPAKRTGTATVTVYVRNVNDLRPRWVTPDYINKEISTTANINTLVTTVVCKDDDLLYNDVTYDQISTQYGGFDYFKTDPYSGEVRSSYVQYEEDMRYFVRLVCKDSDPENDFSGIALVRIDTYVNWKHVTNWTLCKPMADYDATQQAAFLASVATLCPPCIPKIHSITEKDGKAVFHLYFIEDNTTYSKNAREYDKKFIETSTILERYYDAKQKGPKKSVTDNPVFGGCLVNITQFADPPKDNWFLDYIEGNIVLGMLMSLGFALLMTAVICAVRKAAPGKIKIPPTPKGRPTKVQKPSTPIRQLKTPKTPPRSPEKRAKTPAESFVSEDDSFFNREPTPKPIRKKHDKFV